MDKKFKSLGDTPLEGIRSLVEAVALVPLVTPSSKSRKPYKLDIRTKRRKVREYRSTRKEQRAMEEDRLVDQYHKLKRAYKSKNIALSGSSRGEAKNWAFEMSLGEWITMWSECPAVEVGLNTYKPAWMLRGKTKDSVMIKRINTKDSFNINNLDIVKGGERLWSSLVF